MPAPNDSRFEWIHVPEVGNEDQWVRGRCKHRTPVPVNAHPTGELVAHLCPDCDAQFPAEWSPPRHSIPVLAEVTLTASPYRGGPEVGPVARPRPFLLEPGERLMPLRRGNST